MKAPPPGGKVYMQGEKAICIMDPEFRDLLEPLEPRELAQLEANLIRDGRVLEPIVVWAEEMIMLDGHHRLPIAIERDLNFDLRRLNFETRDAALNWVIDHQQGRRNLSEEGRKRLTEWRRDRVAKAREAGESAKSIAEREKVSPKTVRKDLKARGVRSTPSPANPVKGRDKKVYKTRAERVGQAAPETFVPKGERQPGDDTDAIKAEKKAARTAPKPGKPLFDWTKFNKHFAGAMAEIARFGKAYKCFNTDQRKALTQHFADCKVEFMTWYKAVAKQRAPMEPHERGRKGKK